MTKKRRPGTGGAPRQAHDAPRPDASANDDGSRPRWAARASAAAARSLPPDLRTAPAGLLAGFVTCIATTGGLFQWQPLILAALVTGTVTALVVRRPTWLAGAAAALASLLAVAVAMPLALRASPLPAAASGAFMLAVAALAAGWLVAEVLDAPGPDVTRWIAVAVFLILAVNLWFSAFRIGSSAEGGTGALERLSQRPKAVPARFADHEFFLRVITLMEQGKGYYPAYAQAHEENLTWGGLRPGIVFGIREPVMFRVWFALGSGRRIVAALLVLATLGMAAALALARSSVPLEAALPAAAAVAAYYLSVATQPYALDVTSWAVPFVLVSLAALAHSYSGKRPREAVVLAVAAAVLAFAIRELTAYVLIAGSAVSFLSPKETRRFRLAAWGSGILAAALVYLAHYLGARHVLVPLGAQPGVDLWFQGGIGDVWAAITHATSYLGKPGPGPYLLAALGVSGIAAFRHRDMRWMLLGTAVLPLVGFLILGTGYEETVAGVTTKGNYWGVLVVPVLYAAMPAVLYPLIASGQGAEGRPRSKR